MKHRFNLNIPEDMMKDLEGMASVRGVTLTYVIIQLLRLALVILKNNHKVVTQDGTEVIFLI